MLEDSTGEGVGMGALGEAGSRKGERSRPRGRGRAARRRAADSELPQLPLGTDARHDVKVVCKRRGCMQVGLFPGSAGGPPAASLARPQRTQHK